VDFSKKPFAKISWSILCFRDRTPIIPPKKPLIRGDTASHEGGRGVP